MKITLALAQVAVVCFIGLLWSPATPFGQVMSIAVVVLALTLPVVALLELLGLFNALFRLLGWTR